MKRCNIGLFRVSIKPDLLNTCERGCTKYLGHFSHNSLRNKIWVTSLPLALFGLSLTDMLYTSRGKVSTFTHLF